MLDVADPITPSGLASDVTFGIVDFLHNLQQISGTNPLIDYGAWHHAWGDRKLTSHGKSNLNFSKTNPKGQSGALFGKPASVRFFVYFLPFLP